MQTEIACTLMRGGTSKGLYFSSGDLPADPQVRDAVLRAAMGSPDARQIDGLGGAHPLTSKVAVIKPSARDDADIDYLFLQVAVDKVEVSDSQNCGNILAGVGPFAIELGLIAAKHDTTPVRIHMVNTGGVAIARVQTPKGVVEYAGDARIDGVPGTAAPVMLEFLDIAGASCGALLPTGNVVDRVDGIEVTCIDNGMPVVVVRASDFGKSGYETPDALEGDAELKARIEILRLKAAKLMNLGDVTEQTVPKMSLVATAQQGGVITTRTFIPHRVHEAIGVLGAVSVATACLLPGTVAHTVSERDAGVGKVRLDVEHPSGYFTVEMKLASGGGQLEVERTALLRTARLLMRGTVMVPNSVWEGHESD